jgi:hypothetical protein
MFLARRVLLPAAVLVFSACGQSAASRGAESASAPAAAPPPGMPAPEQPPFAGAAEEAEAPAPATAATSAAPAATQPAPAPPAATAAGVTQPSSTATAKSRMLDIEAHLTLKVEDVPRAVAELRQLTQASGGDVVEESIQDAAAMARAELTLRVPSQAADDVLQKVEAVGSLITRQVSARDVGKQYFDGTLRLENLGWSLKRFEQILTRANSVDEIMRVEQEISRVRGQIEQLKGELRFIADRAARATLHVSLLGPEVVVEPPVTIARPEAKFHPGVRLTYAGDFWGKAGDGTYGGAGISLRLSRHFSADVDGLRSTDGNGDGLDLFLATLGGELYSDFLGGGRRKWLNPFLGFRAGYARLAGRNEIAVGGSIGVEILQTEFVTLELDTRSYGMFGSSAGAHLTIQPALGANIAF